jgi:hypothetical protein
MHSAVLFSAGLPGTPWQVFMGFDATPPQSGRIYKNSGRIYKIFTCRPKKLAGFEDFAYICSQITTY